MSGHAVPVDAWGGSLLPLPLFQLVCAPLTPTTYAPILGHAECFKMGE